MYTRPLVLFFFLSLAALSFAQTATTTVCTNGKVPSTAQCLLDPCFGQRDKCPNYPRAVCGPDPCSSDPCGGAQWTLLGKVIDCSKPAPVGICPDGSNPTACLIDPCSQAKCPNHPNAICSAQYCGGNGCPAVFFENGHVVNDCVTPTTDSCLGKCAEKPTAPLCKDPAQPQLSYCGASGTDTTKCEWKSQCAGKCCITDIGFNCSEKSLTNGDYCGEGSTCCLTSDALGEGAHSFSCCPSGTFCARNPVPSRGGGNFCAGNDNPCANLPLPCPTGQKCIVEKGQPICTQIPIVTDPCLVTLCIEGTYCKADSTGKANCLPFPVNPCTYTKCAAGYICVATGTTGGCVPEKGKPGDCPVVKEGSIGTCHIECASDLQCNGTKKCCKNACGGGVCTEPVTGTVKAGSCPADFTKPATDVSICLAECSADSDCEGELKCCSSNCHRKCVKPAGSTCTCPKLEEMLLTAKFAAPRVCPDGTTGGWKCNTDTCGWEWNECKCTTCDLTAFASNVATSSIDSTSVSICLASVAQYDATTKTAAATTATDSAVSVSAEYLRTCYGGGSCTLVGDKCVSTWGCGSCLPVPPTPKCIRAGCQREKCVAPGDAITKECAAPSHEFACLEKSVCDVDSTGKCGWQHTEDYKKCVANPVVDSKLCATTDPCKCSADANCFWCLSSRFQTLDVSNKVLIPAGKCLSRSLMKKCLAPVALDGFAGNVVDRVTDCKLATGDLETLIDSKDPITVDIKIAAEIAKKSDLSGIKVRIDTILTPEKLAASTDGGIARTIVVVDPKPTDVQRPILCKLIADSLLSSTGKVFVAANCKMSEIEASASASGSVKRQATSSEGTFLHETEATSASQSSASGIPRDFIISAVFLVVGLFFAW